MKVILGFLMVLGANAFAADSSWLICNDGKLVMNVYEHRDSNGSDRDTDLTLIYGGWEYHGLLNTSDPSSAPDKNGFQSVWINGANEDQDEFNGKIKIDYSAPSVMMKGEAYFGGAKFDINTTLKCKELGNL